MHEDMIPVMDKLEQAVSERNAQEIISILTSLQEVSIYSNDEVYHRFEKIKSELILVLFDTLDIIELCQIFHESNKIHSFDIWESLESISDRVSFETLWVMKDYYGLPGLGITSKLYATLSDEPNVKISEELVDIIERLSVQEFHKGTDYSEHQERMSAFRFIRWAPDDTGLSDMVRLLGSRNDSVSHAACKKYLLELPWGIDRRATETLLDGMSRCNATKHLELFRLALSVHQEPLMLRL